MLVVLNVGSEQTGRISRRVTEKAGKIVCLCRVRQSNDLLRVFFRYAAARSVRIPILVESNHKGDSGFEIAIFTPVFRGHYIGFPK